MAICKASSALQFTQRVSPSSRNVDGAFWTPNTDVYVTEGKLVIKVEVSGIKREDLELTAEGNRLTISGQRQDSCRPNSAKCKFLLMGIEYGVFQTVVAVPSEYDLSQARAAYQNGFLRIDVPEKAPADQGPISVPVSS